MIKKKMPFALLLLVSLFYQNSTMTAQVKQTVSEQLQKCIRKTIQNPLTSLAEEELVYLSPAELKLFENFIFTRRYTELRDPSLHSFFVASDKKLTPVIKKDSQFIRATAWNLELLQAFRKADSVTTKEQEKFTEMLDGYWQEGTSVIGSTLLTNYHFLAADHSFALELKTTNSLQRLRGYSGFFNYTDGKLELEIRTRILLKGGTLKSKKMPSGKTYTWLVDAKETTENLDEEYDYQWLENGAIYTLRFDGLEKQFMRVGGKFFWKCFPAE